MSTSVGRREGVRWFWLFPSHVHLRGKEGRGEMVLAVPNESHLKFVEQVNDVGLHVISIERGVLEEDI